MEDHPQKCNSEVITPNNATVKYIIATASSFSFYGDAQSTASSFKKIQNTRETIFVVFFVSFHWTSTSESLIFFP